MNTYNDIIHEARPASSRPKMALGDRAKIFSPFAALRGFEETVRERERLLVARALLSEYAQDLLERKLRQVRKRDQASVTFFRMEQRVDRQELGTYVTESGTVTELDPVKGILRLDNRTIPLTDIIDIRQHLPDTGQDSCSDTGTEKKKVFCPF